MGAISGATAQSHMGTTSVRALYSLPARAGEEPTKYPLSVMRSGGVSPVSGLSLHGGPRAMTHPAHALSWPLASAAARGLGHRLGPTRDFGVMRTATCTKCGLYAVENVSDGAGGAGPVTVEKCGGKK